MSGDVSNRAAGPVLIGVRPATPVGLTVESVACSAFAKYNPGFPRKLHGRILPAHFFWPICFLLDHLQDKVGLAFDELATRR